MFKVEAEGFFLGGNTRRVSLHQAHMRHSLHGDEEVHKGCIELIQGKLLTSNFFRS